jgi:pyochelin synthetase
MRPLELLQELEQQGVRFWIETENLRFRAPRGVMTEERRQVLREHKQVLLEALRQRSQVRRLTPQPDSRYDPFPLTEVQTAYLLGRGGAYAYGGLGCHGYGEIPFPELRPELLAATWQALIRRHDMLRAIVREDGTQQVLAGVPEFEIRIIDLRGAAPERVRAEIDGLRARMDHRVYQANVWPLFDLCVTLKDDGPLLHFSLDLLIADFVSTQRLLAELYERHLTPERPVSPLEVTFRDYLLATQGLRETEDYRRDRGYWMERLETLPPAPQLPVREHAADALPRFTRRELRLTRDEWASMLSWAGKHGFTASTAVLLAYSEAVGRWCREPRFSLNLTLQNRLPLHPQVDELIGDFTSLSLLAVELDPCRRLLDKAHDLQARLWEDLDHRLFSGSEVMRELAQRQGQEAALFPIVFTSSVGISIHAAKPTQGLGELSYGITQTPQVWIDCQVMESRGGLVVNWDARQDIFPPGVLDAMFRAFAQLLRRMAGDGTVWEQTDPIALPPEQAERQQGADDTTAALPGLLHEALVAQALRDPGRPAVITSQRTLTFGELLQGAMVLAEALRGAAAQEHELVGVALKKGYYQPLAVLGTLLAGCVYVPLPTEPLARRSQILADAGISRVIVHSSGAAPDDWPPGTRCIAIDRLMTGASAGTLPTPRVEPGDPAYVIYTSGSTGTAKGVVMSHRSAANTVVDVNRRFGVSSSDRILGLSNLGFDLSVYDLFGPPSVGGCLVLPDADRSADPSHWAQLIAAHRVTIWNSVPAQLQMLYEYACASREWGAPLAPLRLALLSGDWLPVQLPDQIRQLVPALKLVSLGGATEAAIWSIFHLVTDVPPHWRTIPYGRPLTNQRVYVLDAALRPCPDWVVGELYIGGAGLALGYLGDAARTADRFLHHPATRERLYRTGDLGRYSPDGFIELLGREDRQVKIRGYRIELSEVEAALRAHPAVARAAVLVDGPAPSERRLLAFVEPGPRGQAQQAPPEYARWKAEARAAGADLARVAKQAGYTQYVRQLDQAALLTMLFSLRQLELFADKALYPEHVLASVPGCCQPAVRRWLRALTLSGFLTLEPESRRYRMEKAVDPEFLEQTWHQVAVAGQGFDDERLIARLACVARRLPDALRSGTDAERPFCLEQARDLLQAAPRGTLGGRWARRVAAVLARQIRSWVGQEFRVLDLGAHAPLCADEPSLLSGPDVQLLITDPSPQVLKAAQQGLGDRSSLQFASFNPNQDYRSQGFQPNSYDLVVASNVLHRTRDVDEALRQVRELLAPCGWLLLLELSRSSLVFLAVLEPLLAIAAGTEEFTDQRRGDDNPFLAPAPWREAIARAGGETVICLPDDNEVIGQPDVRVIVARFKQDRARVTPDELSRFLTGRLPYYMVSSQIQVLDVLPLTANAKVDFAKLQAWVTPGHAPCWSEKSGLGTQLESRILGIWNEVLNTGGVGRDQAFLSLGGNSLSAARLAGRLRESIAEFMDLPFDQLLRYLLDGTTVSQLSRLLTTQRPTGPAQAKRAAVGVHHLGGEGPPCRAIVHDGSGKLAYCAGFRNGLAAQGTLLGLAVTDVTAYLELAPETLIEHSAAAYVDALIDAGSLQIVLVGGGRGSALAVEIARQLTEAGAIVEHLFLIGALPPDPLPAQGAESAADESYQHFLRGLRGYDVPAYSGDITLLIRPEDSAWRDEAISFWRQVCLGELRILETGADSKSVLQALLAPPPQ